MKIAVSRIGRQRPFDMGDDGAYFVRAWDIDADLEFAPLTFVGMSVLSPPAADAQAAHDILRDQPRSCASARMLPSDPRILRTMARDRSARSRSSNARTIGAVNCASFTVPIIGAM